MRLSFQETVNKKENGTLLHSRKKGRYPTHASQIKLHSTKKPIKVMYAAINSKLVNIVRFQKAQGTETTQTQPCYNIDLIVANVVLVSSQPIVLAWSLIENFLLRFFKKELMSHG